MGFFGEGEGEVTSGTPKYWTIRTPALSETWTAISRVGRCRRRRLRGLRTD